jgi:hypothetical protein
MRGAGGALVALVGVVGLCGPAAADVRSFPGDDTSWDVPAKYDIERVRVSNGDHHLGFKVRLERVRPHGMRVFVRWHMADEPGWVFEATTGFRQGKKVSRLYVWPNTEQRNRVRCSHATYKWRPGADGTVRLTFPEKCIYGLRTFDDFEVMTIPNGTVEAFDGARSPEPLPAD